MRTDLQLTAFIMKVIALVPKEFSYRLHFNWLSGQYRNEENFTNARKGWLSDNLKCRMTLIKISDCREGRCIIING
jgi:hypothetical protein